MFRRIKWLRRSDPCPNLCGPSSGRGASDHKQEGPSVGSPRGLHCDRSTTANTQMFPKCSPRRPSFLENQLFNWWRRRESNPRPQALHPRLYMLILSITFAVCYPTGREHKRLARKGFNGSVPGRPHRVACVRRPPIRPCGLRAHKHTRSEASGLKPLERSCRRWQLFACSRIYEEDCTLGMHLRLRYLRRIQVAPFSGIPLEHGTTALFHRSLQSFLRGMHRAGCHCRRQACSLSMRRFWRCQSRSFSAARLSWSFLPLARPISSLARPRSQYRRSGTSV